MSYCPVAGIDVSKRFSDMCILSPDNKIFAQEKIYHDETSINRSNALLQKAERLFFSKPVIVMESTSHYHLILFQFFSEHGYDVIVVNPLQSNSMKDFSIRKRKTECGCLQTGNDVSNEDIASFPNSSNGNACATPALQTSSGIVERRFEL